ncbi:MAG: Mor transcription activator family protein [Candidatus Gastranaerophilales bacterium]|nr:Mor transcription activator family protein [Candidatus Gastranaerophilales bacterium]
MIINGIEIDIEKITSDDMPNEVFQDIADMCGVEAALNLLTFFAGNTINVPLKGFSKIERKIILQEYDGSNQTIKRLARKLRMSERSVRTVLESSKITPAIEGQISLFERIGG